MINFWCENAYARVFSALGTAQKEEEKDIISNYDGSENKHERESDSDINEECANLDDDTDIFNQMKKYRLKNANKVILATLNINTIANKFTALKEIVSNHIDILIIEETKLDETFPKGSFEIPGFKEPFRKNRNIHGGGVMFFVIPQENWPQSNFVKTSKFFSLK